jgi:hypothetical protein
MGIESDTHDTKVSSGRTGMRSTFYISIFSLAVLSLLGWVRHDTPRASRTSAVDITPDEEIHLFVG